MLGVCIGNGAGKSCPAGVECQLFGGSYVPPEQLPFFTECRGEYTMSMAYLLAWQGPVLEEQDPYGDGYSPDGLSPACHVQEIQVLPEKDYEAVKRAVYLYGGVQSSLYTAMVSDRDDTHYYRKETGAYWYNGDEKPNHDVVIIGWDDHYSRDNFNQPPEGDGAFICANSWGANLGTMGIFTCPTMIQYWDPQHSLFRNRVGR